LTWVVSLSVWRIWRVEERWGASIPE
jgi:hypothetical protein